MFKNTYQNGLLSIFYSCGSSPLAIWDMEVNNGHIKRLTDPEVNSIVLEIVSTNVATTYITCPRNNQNLGIKLPFLVMIVKNLKRYFSFEITILDDKNMRRRFRISNFQSATKIKPFCTTMPIGLSGGWNQIQFNLADFTRRAYGTQYIEALRMQVHANVRLRRIYFAERLYSEEELPQDYKLYVPMEKKKKEKDKKEGGKAAGDTRPALSKKSVVKRPASEVVEEKPPKSEVAETEALPEAPETEDKPPAEALSEAPTDALSENPAEGAEEVKDEPPAESAEEPSTPVGEEAPAEEPPAEVSAEAE